MNIFLSTDLLFIELSRSPLSVSVSLFYTLLATGFSDKPFGKLSTLSWSNHSARHIPADNVKNNIGLDAEALNLYSATE